MRCRSSSGSGVCGTVGAEKVLLSVLRVSFSDLDPDAHQLLWVSSTGVPGADWRSSWRSYPEAMLLSPCATIEGCHNAQHLQR